MISFLEPFSCRKVQIKFAKELWSNFFKVSTFLYQPRDHFKNVDCSASSLVFAKFDLSVN